jgi:hypothetical protein
MSCDDNGGNDIDCIGSDVEDDNLLTTREYCCHNIDTILGIG